MYYSKLITCNDRSVSSNGWFIFHTILRTILGLKGFTSASLNLFIISVLAKFGDVNNDVIFDPLTSFYTTRKPVLFASHTVATRHVSCV
jgi:hypothetical protein